MKKDKEKTGKHEHPLPGKIPPEQKEKNKESLKQAEKDIEADPDLSAHNPNDDLDEGESARLGEDKTGLI